MQDIIEKLRRSRSESELFLIRSELERQLKILEQKESQIEDEYAQLENKKMEIAKYVEFNSQSYASFYNTKLEKDKSILTLSVAGLGFLVTFTNFAEKLGVFSYCAFILAAFAYLTCIYHVVTIFEKNASYIIEITTDSGKEGELEVQLKKHDKIVIRSFYIGIFLSLALGISTSVQSQLKGPKMSDKNKENQEHEVHIGDSFSGLSQLSESFSGLSGMKPKITPIQPSSSAQNSSVETQNVEKKSNE